MEKRRQDIRPSRCPRFCSRIDYKGRSYIRCGGKDWRYPGSSVRESQYRERCCGCYEQCELYKEMEE